MCKREDATRKSERARVRIGALSAMTAFIGVLFICGTAALATETPPGSSVDVTPDGTTTVGVGDTVGYSASCTCAETQNLHWTNGWSFLTGQGGDDDGSDGAISKSGTASIGGTYSISAACDATNPAHGSDSETLKIFACDAISMSDLTVYSINKTGISISATVTCKGNPAPNLTVTFSCGALTFPGGATAVTNASGVATVTANTGSTPSSALDAETVTASVPDGIGNTYGAHDDFTVVKVNDPTPASPSIIVGHYPTNSLYSVLLTFTVSPAISGVPVTFSFQSGQNGFNHAATLEDGASATDANGQTTVRVRSSDLEQSKTVLGTYQESSGSTGVTFLGLTDVTCH